MNGIEAGLFSALVADTALIAELGGETAVYNRHAPQGQALPYVVFFHAGGGHENQNPSDLQSHVYMVKGVAGESKKAGTIDALIVDCLNGSTLTVSGYTNIYMRCEDEVQATEVTGTGDVVYHCGHYVRVRIDD